MGQESVQQLGFIIKGENIVMQVPLTIESAMTLENAKRYIVELQAYIDRLERERDIKRAVIIGVPR